MNLGSGPVCDLQGKNTGDNDSKNSEDYVSGCRENENGRHSPEVKHIVNIYVKRLCKLQHKHDNI